MIVAVPLSDTKRKLIAGSTLVHLTRPADLASIVVDRTPSSRLIAENCTVHLKAGQGWSITPFKLFRDYSVLELSPMNTQDWGRYLYFFHGEPGRWAIFKNIGPLQPWETLQSTTGVIRISGAQLLSKSGRPVFYRADDNVIVVRGDYTGPALVSPLP